MKNTKGKKRFVSIRLKIINTVIVGMIIISLASMAISYLLVKDNLVDLNFCNFAILFLPRLAIFWVIVLIGILLYLDNNIVHPINEIIRVTKEFAFDTNDKRKENVDKIFKLRYDKRNDELGKLYSAIAMTTKESTEFADDIETQSKMIAKMQEGLIMVLSEMVESRDKGTGDHIKKTRAYVELIVKQMKELGIYEDVLTDTYASNTISAAPLHDVGKIHVPDNILTKPGKLTDEEFEIMKTHTTYGAKMLQYTIDKMTGEDAGYLIEAKNVAEYHHEKWNGKGYPNGITGEEIPLSARIMAVADVFDALVSRRSYKEPFSFEDAIKIIKEDSGTHFDPLVVKAFLSAEDEARKIAEDFEENGIME